MESKGWEVEITGSPGAGFELQAGYARLATEYLTALLAQQGQPFSVFEPKHSWRLWAVRRFDLAALTFGVGCNGQSDIAFDADRRQGDGHPTDREHPALQPAHRLVDLGQRDGQADDVTAVQDPSPRQQAPVGGGEP